MKINVGDNVRVHEVAPFDAEVVSISDGTALVAPHGEEGAALVDRDIIEPARNYQRRVELADGLRRLADFVADAVNVPVPTFVTCDLTAYVSEKEEFLDAARRLPRPVEKDFSESFATVRLRFGPAVVYELRASRELVCTKKVIGKEIRKVEKPDPNYRPPMIVEEIEEEVIEWECAPLLKLDPDEIPDAEPVPGSSFPAPSPGAV